MAKDELVERLVLEAPGARAVVDEHLVDNEGELLLHVLLFRIVQICETAWSEADHDRLQRCLAVLDLAISQGDEYVKEAVAVSFVEDSCPGSPENLQYIASWPRHLRAEAARQSRHSQQRARRAR